MPDPEIKVDDEPKGPVTRDDLARLAAEARAGESVNQVVEGIFGKNEPPKEEPTPKPESEIPKVEPAIEEEPHKEEPIQETPKPEAPAKSKEELEHEERSGLGRKLVKIEQDLRNQISAITEELSKTRAKAPPPEDKAWQIPETESEAMAQVERIIEERDRKKQTESLKYQKEYLETTERLGTIEEESMHAEVMKELLNPSSPFNIRRLDIYDPLGDAERNYYKAKTAVLSNKLKSFSTRPVERENPLKGKAPTGPIGVSGTTKVTPKSAPPIELDEYAKNFINSMGLSKEWAEKTLQEK